MSTLTRIFLNPAKRGGRKLIANPQAMHAAVRAAFPPDIDESKCRVLWRLDQREYKHTLYIVGPERPDATHIVQQAGWATRPPETADYDRFLGQLMAGQKWHFELVANPTKALTAERDKRGKVIPLVKIDQQEQWLLDKSARAGFSVATGEQSELTGAAVVERHRTQFEKTGSKAGHSSVKLTTARFSGMLEVTDVEKLRATLQLGLGKGKAYGCGLLTLAKPGTVVTK